MFIGKNRNATGDRSKSPLGNHNLNHAGRRILAVRRIDQAIIKKHCVPNRTFTLPRKEVRKYENSIFDDELRSWQETEQLPPYHDNRFDIPLAKERVRIGRDRNIPRRVRKDGFRTLARAHKLDAEAARNGLGPHGAKAFLTLGNATWQRNEWTKARHMEVRIEDCDMNSPMPTHFMRVSTINSEELDNLLTPVHGTFIRSHWARMTNLPEFTPMDVCTPVNDKGELLTKHEYASGELPMINVRVHNLETMPHLLAYCYARNPGALVEQLVGNLANDFDQFIEKPLTLEQRKMEWEISQKIGANFDNDLIRVHAWFINDLGENGNCVGMEDPAFWWAIETSLRIITDALVVQRRFSTSPGHESDENSDEVEEE